MVNFIASTLDLYLHAEPIVTSGSSGKQDIITCEYRCMPLIEYPGKDFGMLKRGGNGSNEHGHGPLAHPSYTRNVNSKRKWQIIDWFPSSL